MKIHNFSYLRMLPGELARHEYLNGTVHLIGQFHSKLNSLVANSLVLYVLLFKENYG